MASKSTSSRSLSRVKSVLPKSGDLGTIKIEHSIDNVLSAMTKNSYTDAEVLAEIIDNSNSAKRNGVVNIDLQIKKVNGKPVLIIEDDGKGIPLKTLGKVLGLGNSSGKGVNNEHGMGLKQAVLSGGSFLRSLRSKASKEVGYEVTFDSVQAMSEDVRPKATNEQKLGTRLEIQLYKNHGLTNAESFYQTMASLQHIYQQVLGRSLHITVRNDYVNAPSFSLKADQATPHLFNPLYDNSSWLVKDTLLEGDGWKASLSVGYLDPSKTEYTVGASGVPAMQHSLYQRNIEQQGIQFFKGDRLIVLHKKPSVLGIKRDHGSVNGAVIQVKALEGLDTVPTKNNMSPGPEFNELMDHIERELQRLVPDKQPGKVKAPYSLSPQPFGGLVKEFNKQYSATQKETTQRPQQLLAWQDPELTNASWVSVPHLENTAWKLWKNPASNVVVMMHKKGVNHPLEYKDIPSYYAFQCHVKDQLKANPAQIVLIHQATKLLDPNHIPDSCAVSIVTPARSENVVQQWVNFGLMEQKGLKVPRPVNFDEHASLDLEALNRSQRALLAAKAATSLKGIKKMEFYEQMDVDPVYISKARAVLELAPPGVQEQVLKGNLSLNKALDPATFSQEHASNVPGPLFQQLASLKNLVQMKKYLSTFPYRALSAQAAGPDFN